MEELLKDINDRQTVDIKLLQEFPRQVLKEYRLLPVQQTGELVLMISDSRPPLPVIDDLEVYSNYRLRVELVEQPIIDRLFNEYLDAPLDTVEEMLDDIADGGLGTFSELELDTGVENLEELAREAPIIRLVNAIITTALKKGASDIHLEPFEKEMKVRYRIDGVLFEKQAPPRKLFPAIITRIKIMANLNIAERRLPQDGRIRIKVLGRELDIRVSTMPTLYGESVVLRLLDRARSLLDLNNLGFAPTVLQQYLDLISYPHGIILVTGPTGSGKTTTLYATLHQLNSPEKKIITIEDPVEYQLQGINQIQVKPEIDFTFARGLRSILRQDPDIVMVGEIRDVETAKIAIQAALTGHLVFATLHTNDAAGAITRLINMGVEDYLLAATVRGILAQRLVRTLCLECRQPYSPDDFELKKVEPHLQAGEEIFHPVGCENCGQIGYRGRMGIYELLPITEKMERLINRGADTNRIKEESRRLGIKTLYLDGLEKVRAGLTSLDEVIRVTRS